MRHPLGTSDFSSFMLQAQASKADVVAIANGGDDAINAVKTAREFGITDKQKSCRSAWIRCRQSTPPACNSRKA